MGRSNVCSARFAWIPYRRCKVSPVLIWGWGRRSRDVTRSLCAYCARAEAQSFLYRPSALIGRLEDLQDGFDDAVVDHAKLASSGRRNVGDSTGGVRTAVVYPDLDGTLVLDVGN